MLCSVSEEGKNGSLEKEPEDIPVLNEACNCLLCARTTPACLMGSNPAWVLITRVAFFVLHKYLPNITHLNMRTNVYPFVQAHWKTLGMHKKDTKKWRKHMLDALCHGGHLFQSGQSVFHQTGLWKLHSLQDPWTLVGSSHFKHFQSNLHPISQTWHGRKRRDSSKRETKRSKLEKIVSEVTPSLMLAVPLYLPPIESLVDEQTEETTNILIEGNKLHKCSLQFIMY